MNFPVELLSTIKIKQKIKEMFLSWNSLFLSFVVNSRSVFSGAYANFSKKTQRSWLVCCAITFMNFHHDNFEFTLVSLVYSCFFYLKLLFTLNCHRSYYQEKLCLFPSHVMLCTSSSSSLYLSLCDGMIFTV